MSEFRLAMFIASLIGAGSFMAIGLIAITPITQVLDAATSMSHDRIFSAIILCLLTAIAVKQ